MSRINNILGQLQDKLVWKYDKSVDIEEIGQGFINQYPPDEDEDIDVPETSDTPYVTHRPFILPTAGKKGNKLPFEGKNIKEQEEDEESSEEVASRAAEAGEDIAGDIEPTGDEGSEPATPDMGGSMDTGMDTGMGMPGMEPEEPKTSGQLGRIYELKKIYARLTSIESYLGNESTPELLEIRNLVSKAIELFEVVSSNFDSYKDRLDEIIVTYYKFILEVYKEVENYFRKETKSGD